MKKLGKKLQYTDEEVAKIEMAKRQNLEKVDVQVWNDKLGKYEVKWIKTEDIEL
jgi:hypothetical protein